MSKTKEMIEVLEEFMVKKVKTFEVQTSTEELMVFSELVRALTILKRSDHSIDPFGN